MHFHVVNILGLAAAASAAVLQKRCSPIRDPEYQNGYLPPVPCWLSPSPACQPEIPEGIDIEVDGDAHSAVVRGVSDTCVETILEEQARERDGRKAYGWTANIGKLDVSKKGTLVITEMSDKTVDVYCGLVGEEHCSNSGREKNELGCEA